MYLKPDIKSNREVFPIPDGPNTPKHSPGLTFIPSIILLDFSFFIYTGIFKCSISTSV